MQRAGFSLIPMDNIEQFGKQLIDSGDLDPIYIALDKTLNIHTEPSQLFRWLIAYWCFYHAGLACWLSQWYGWQFWSMLARAAANDTPSPLGEDWPRGRERRWPRGRERRHARGLQGRDMVARLASMYGEEPERMVVQLILKAHNGVTCGYMMKAVQRHYMFGPWIAFKVCDMMERVLRKPIDFNEADVFMFSQPTKSALMVWENIPSYYETMSEVSDGDKIKEVVEYLIATYRDFLAPPHYDRPIRLQEVETILCKWKSHLSGHYPLYNDIREIREGLIGWGNTAEKFLEGMPADEDD